MSVVGSVYLSVGRLAVNFFRPTRKGYFDVMEKNMLPTDRRFDGLTIGRTDSFGDPRTDLKNYYHRLFMHF